MDCNSVTNQHKLQHDGTAQNARPMPGLQPGHVLVEEHGLADWIVFARGYARFLQYYDLENQASGDWTAFWGHNPALLLANLAAAQVDWFREETRLIFIALQKLDNQSDTLLLQQNFRRLFDAVATLAMRMDQHIRRLPDELPIKTTLNNLVRTSLAPALKNWMGWQKKAALFAPPLLQPGDAALLERVRQMQVLGEGVQEADWVWANYDFSALWWGGAADWAALVGEVDAGVLAGAYDQVYGNPLLLTTVEQRINFALRHFFFANAFEQFLKGFAKMSAEAGAALAALLAQWNRHEPHFALFLAFLRLLSHGKDHLNGLTERHLRFYYNRVLRLSERQNVPSEAFVAFELAKHVDSFLLPAGTALKAGKDALGKEILYSLTEDFVPNKAQVAALQSVFKAPDDPLFYQNLSPELPAYRSNDRRRYFAAPMSNSADGAGAKLQSADGQWHPFGNKTLNAAKQWQMSIPQADIGFAIASNYLYMTEGQRTLRITFNGATALGGKKFKVSLSAEKGWHEGELTALGNQLTWTLDGNHPPIVPYSAKVHGGNFSTGQPLLTCVLLQDDAAVYAYEDLKNQQITSIDLFVEVIGKKKIALSGSTGPLDGAKPFHPFGPAPELGAVFVLGDKELFQKRATATLAFEWKEQYASYGSGGGFFHEHRSVHPYSSFEVLEHGSWAPSASGEMLPLTDITPDTNFSLTDAQLIAPDYGPNNFYTAGATRGFARFRLRGDWGHSLYPAALAEYAKSGTGDAPLPLYDPQLLSLSLRYTASTNIPLHAADAHAAQTGQYFHLHPFGFEEVVPQSASTRLLPLLVPQFASPAPGTLGRDGGEWYIGVKNLVPAQTLSLLVQVAEGSADPLIEKPAQHLRWAYLRHNQWVDFEQEAVADGTNGLLQSGIVRLAVPEDANADNTVLASGLHWFRASVAEAADAVCRVIGVHAQAARARREDRQNDPALDALPLPAGSIGKLQAANSAVKKVEQPYAAFGGKAAESSGPFFTRVSERLRHKDRAIALWDYERIVLEAFPLVHKAKCLNHVRFEQQNGQTIYRELAPGHVTLLVIAQLRNLNAVNPLRPYVSLADLARIEAHLKQRSSCFAQLHVKNPVFEPIQAVFKVKLFPGYDETFYARLLSDEIVRFLSPWAFEAGQDIGFGGKTYRSSLINFVEERPYVDYVLDFKLIHYIGGVAQPDSEVVEPSKQYAILVSADAHLIEVLDAEPPSGVSEDCGCQVSAAAAGAFKPENNLTTNLLR
jgi:hypothetical protein